MVAWAYPSTHIAPVVLSSVSCVTLAYDGSHGNQRLTLAPPTAFHTFDSNSSGSLSNADAFLSADVEGFCSEPHDIHFESAFPSHGPAAQKKFSNTAGYLNSSC